MAELQKRTIAQRWDQMQPTKTTLFWACAGACVATLVIGFSWGGWVTGGGARAMSEKAAQQAHQDLASVVCTTRFAAAADARMQLAALNKITSSYQRGKFVEEGGWATMPGATTADRKAAAACAEGLRTLELPPAAEAAQISDEPIVVQPTPTAVGPEPMMMQPVPTVAEPEPTAVEPEPTVAQ